MNATSLDDVIAAISTPSGVGGIGIVRVSGAGSLNVVDKIFKSKFDKKLLDIRSHTIIYGTIVDTKTNHSIDEVLVSVMLAPNTYTKEDVVEINCHGGIIVVKKILELCLNEGARLAEPGEFTKRAFLNGRIDLTQAEAVIDVICSKTDLSRQLAVNQLEGKLKIAVRDLREQILDMVASIEAVIDYPEHEVEIGIFHAMYEECKEITSKICNLLDSSNKGKILREGIETVILGKPNVGKSSLLNYLLDEERAIVTDIPGTTRDTVEEYINIEGIPIKIVDTAGIRETDNIVEKMGVEKSKNYAANSDLILLVLDSSKKLQCEDWQILNLIKSKNVIVLLNKIDLKSNIELDEIYHLVDKKNVIEISVLENKGIENLKLKIKELFLDGNIEINNEILVGNVRHTNALFLAKQGLEKAMNTIETNMPDDFISMDLQEVLTHLGEITGDTMNEEIIDRIFTKFCLGK